MSSLGGRSRTTEIRLEERELSSTIQTILFIPYFSAYVLLSTLLSLFLRGAGGVLNSFLAVYTLQRLLLGFVMLIFWRLVRWVAECTLQACDCFFRTQHESNLIQEINDANSYQEYRRIGCQLDDFSQGIKNWKVSPISDDYDYELLTSQLKSMQKIRNYNKKNTKNLNCNELNDASKLMYSISHVFRRTFCSLHNGHLYDYTYVGTKDIINQFYNTLEENIEYIANCDKPSLHEKMEFFHRCKRSLGRTALCLSGGGALAMAHVGVVRALIANDCFPKVISGTSGGAIIAGYLATLTDEELKNDLDGLLGYDLSNKFGVRFLPTLWEQLFGAYRKRVLMDTQYFVNSIKKYVGNTTFREAWMRTGRHVSIVVSYSTKNKPNKSHAHAIVLNHITSPDTMIWSAVTASCALPGLMKPQTLVAKDNKTNTEVPYYPDGVQWVDGSLQADIPTDRLQEMFRVNYFIVSQVNPHVTPFIMKASRLERARRALMYNAYNENFNQSNQNLRNLLFSGDSIDGGSEYRYSSHPVNRNSGRSSSSRSRSSGSNGSESIITQISRFGIQVLEMLDDLGYETVNHQLDRLVKLKAIPAVYGQSFDKLASQKFTGDITVVPKVPLSLRFKVLAHPTEQDMREYIKIGEKATWPHISHIYNMLRIEKLIDAKINQLRMIQSGQTNIGNNIYANYNNISHISHISNVEGRNDSSYYLNYNNNNSNNGNFYYYNSHMMNNNNNSGHNYLNQLNGVNPMISPLFAYSQPSQLLNKDVDLVAFGEQVGNAGVGTIANNKNNGNGMNNAANIVNNANNVNDSSMDTPESSGTIGMSQAQMPSIAESSHQAGGYSYDSSINVSTAPINKQRIDQEQEKEKANHKEKQSDESSSNQYSSNPSEIDGLAVNK